MRHPSATPDVGDLARMVENGFSTIVDVARMVNRLPDNANGRTDPVALGRWAADAAALAISRFQMLPEVFKGTSGPPDPAAFQRDVTTYLDEARRALAVRLLSMTAKWPACTFTTTLVNPGAVSFLGLVVRLHLPRGRPADRTRRGPHASPAFHRARSATV